MTKRLRVVEPGHEQSWGPPDGLPDEDEPRPRGRPRGSGREVVATHTVRLERHQQDELTRIAASAGRSVHSLFLEGIDLVIARAKHREGKI